MQDLANLGFNDNLSEWYIIKEKIPDDAIAVDFYVKSKKQVNEIGKQLDIDHAFAVIKLVAYRSKYPQYYYALCDFGLKVSILHIGEKQATELGKILKTCEIKHGVTFMYIKDIASKFNANYNLISNNCSHFVKYMQQNLQKYDQPTVEMDSFTEQQLKKGLQSAALPDLLHKFANQTKLFSPQGFNSAEGYNIECD